MAVLAGRPIAVRLAVSAVFWSSLVLLVAGFILTTLYRRSTERSFDERLLVYANDVAADLVAPADGDKRDFGGLGEPRFQIPLSGWYWQVGRLGAAAKDLTSSRSLVDNALPFLASGDPKRPFGGTRVGEASGPESRLLRLLERDIDLGEDGRYVVRIAAPADEIAAAIRAFVAALAITFVLLGIGLGLSILLQIRFGLRPLTELSHAVSTVRRGQAERISGSYPADVAPLADELNLLLDANREILERARTQVGNLAHALKTPLSVIVNEVDAPADDTPARIREQAAVMRDQVDYYLRRARTAALSGTLGTMTEVEDTMRALERTFGKIYRDRSLTLSLDVAAGLTFRGERQDLEEMAGNLVDNACKWANGTVAVRAEAIEASPTPRFRIVVDDDGPGMPKAARADAVMRGKRLDETRPGSGLGLSIVSDLADDYGGSMRIDASALGGTRVELELPGGREA